MEISSPYDDMNFGRDAMVVSPSNGWDSVPDIKYKCRFESCTKYCKSGYSACIEHACDECLCALALYQCIRCGKAKYCSKACQKLAWKYHKIVCS